MRNEITAEEAALKLNKILLLEFDDVWWWSLLLN